MPESSIYRVMIENALDAFFLTKPDGVILDVNAAACEMFGYTLDEFKIAGRRGIIDPESPGLADRLEERKLKGKITCELTNEYQRKSTNKGFKTARKTACV